VPDRRCSPVTRRRQQLFDLPTQWRRARLKSGARANEREARRKVVKTVAPLLYALPEDYSYRVVFCLRPHLKAAWILHEVMGSDHCPVGIELEF